MILCLFLFRCFTQLAPSIMIHKSFDQLKTSADYRHYFPNFLWLLRDVSLKIPDGQTPQQFIMGHVIKQNKAVGEAIMTLFPSVDCKTLPIPTAKRSILYRIKECESELEPQFLHRVKGLTEYLRENVKVKHGFSHSQRVDGPTLALLLEQYLEAVNIPGTIPCLENTWNTVVEMRCSEVIHSLVKEYEREMEQALHDKLPVEEEATPEEDSDPDQRQQQVFLMEVHSQILRRKEEKLLKEIKNVTPATNALEAGNTQYKMEVVNRLQSKIIEARFDKMKVQVVTGGVILRFIRENYEKSHAYCVKCFDEVSAPLLENLRSMMGSVTITTATPEIDAPRYSFQQFMDDRANLQAEYFARAIGPAKQKVWEEKVASLKEWESMVIALDDYQKEKLYQKLATTAKNEEKLRDLVVKRTACSSRLESVMEQLETRLTQENQDNLQRIERDAAEKLAEGRRKLKDLDSRQEISESELKAKKQQLIQLQKEKEQAERQQKLEMIEAITELKAEYKAAEQQSADLVAQQKEERAKHERDMQELKKGMFIAILSEIYASFKLTYMLKLVN